MEKRQKMIKYVSQNKNYLRESAKSADYPAILSTDFADFHRLKKMPEKCSFS